ncbi:MAG: UDP-N-acetylmuramoyl-L-alanyl-D-glutamate--2,6-diaminopimelate ligase [Saprospiraceae bacterium]|nr:UDP-N-acetylmuramoyl-L-alanyl-D-glutamate--2,6-diaminopimelate ligase [Saprospiraceae bacterium]
MDYLNVLLKALQPVDVIGKRDRLVRRIDFDSRKVEKGSLFVAVKGVQVDGHRFIQSAIDNGATTIVAERLPEKLEDHLTYIKVANSAEALGLLADAFYEQPSKQLQLVGVTGTNGKTTTVTLLHDLFTALGYKCGLLSTIQNKIGTELIEATHTTPDAVSINALLAEMVASGCSYAFMEVSSHAVDQKRIFGLHFAGGIFTNISHDHLDYHKTFKAYIEAKKGFFDQLGKKAFSLVNIDDRRGMVMVQNTASKVYRYGLKNMADFKGKIFENSLLGLQMELDGEDFFGRLIGRFNAYNLLAVYAAAVLLEQDKMEVLTALSGLRPAEGRFDAQFYEARKVTAVVDYAHTPDALENVLETIADINDGAGQIITVVGCGGDRDAAKRPKMAKIACQWSHQVILTSDNPRTEDPEAILKDMEAGLTPDQKPKTITISDRRQAIRTAVRLAKAGDIVLVAGKGHEKYQEINGVKYPFDDKEILKEEFSV